MAIELTTILNYGSRGIQTDDLQIQGVDYSTTKDPEATILFHVAPNKAAC